MSEGKTVLIRSQGKEKLESLWDFQSETLDFKCPDPHIHLAF